MSTTDEFGADDPLGAPFRTAIQAAIDEFLEARRANLAAIDASLVSLADAAIAASAGGKHLRPAFLWWGSRAVAGAPADPAALLRAAASLDLLHAGLLVHDDLIDRSDTRRGRPAAHNAFAREHAGCPGATGDPAAYGAASAILLGTVLVTWSAEAFDASGLPAEAVAAARPALAEMRTEVLAGQWLDLRAQHRLPLWSPDFGTTARLDDPSAARQVVQLKTALYTVARPIQAGALAAGADAGLVACLGRFGAPLGRAFQYRDDLLDAFGDPAVTGKPAGGDLREGKRTLLVATALDRGTPTARRRLSELLGRPGATEADLDELRRILTETGARASVETLIAQEYEAALSALAGAGVSADGRAGLSALARFCVERER